MKKKKSMSAGLLFGSIASIRERYRRFRTKVGDIKRRKELALVESTVPPREKKDQMVVVLNPASVAKSAAYILFILLLFYFFFEIRGILMVLFISFLFAAALDPLVDRLQKKGLPRAVSVILIYIVVFVFIGLFATNVVTLIAGQVVDIATNVGQFVTNLSNANSSQVPFAVQLKPYIDQFYQTVNLQAAASQLQNALQIVANQLLSISIGLLNLLIVLILTFFMTVEEKAIEEFFRSLFPSRYSRYISTRLEAVKDQVGFWLRGQFLVSLICGVMTYVGLVLMGVDYALTLSVIAGIAMVIPVVGRVFAWVIAFPIVFNQSSGLSLWMSLYYFLLQQIESNIIVPYVMNKAVGLSPIIIIIAMMIGGQYLGVLGLVLSIPIATTVAIFVRDYAAKTK